MFILIDKAKGITSHDVIDELRKITGIRKIGHAGTLDPNATGLLIVGIGRESTRKLGSIAKETKKTYEAEIVLGEERETDDAEGEVRDEILRLPSVAQDDKLGEQIVPRLSNIETVLKEFVGELEQVPPEYSAIKIKGKKAYQLARQAKKVELKHRKITIYSIKLLSYYYPILKINCEVSSGTYIRSLARDIGRKLGTGAYLKELRRLKIGEFALENAVKLSDLTSNNWQSFVVEL